MLFSAPKNELCPQCGAETIIRSGKHGAFLGCSDYPQCNYIRPLKQQADGHIIKVLEAQRCPLCLGELVLRQGHYGMFIGCHNYPQCEHTETIDPPDETSIGCPQCKQGKLVQRRSRYGKAFHACDRFPECQYAVNYTPIEGQCAHCQFPLFIEKKNKRGVKRFCASKACGKPVDTGNACEP
ncbi:putative DNA topoisomerase [Izhakiella capsodis]|uniref:Putative DNA topoisomerase n=2 Tax=Izhakiella capsodis TaxID=1367852 RepID=A0A1I5BIB5_9GAMM|nr:putative DNA topoisomerase [Izhakiella capsodis]